MVHAPTDSCGGRPRRLPSIVVTSAAAIWFLTMTHVGNERVGWDVGVLVEVAVPSDSVLQSVVQIVVLS